MAGGERWAVAVTTDGVRGARVLGSWGSGLGVDWGGIACCARFKVNIWPVYCSWVSELEESGLCSTLLDCAGWVVRGECVRHAWMSSAVWAGR